MSRKTILVIATRNKGKAEEIKKIPEAYPVEIMTLDDFGPIPEVVEDGETFDENAYKKSSFTARVLGFPVLSDDSGLSVEALNGAPGVYSARYAGDSATDKENNEKLLKEMAGKTNRKAAFECIISIAVPTGPALTYEGRCEGIITKAPVGNEGFGYDPVFFSPEYQKTFAELTMAEKSSISHRGNALAEMGAEFDKVLTWIEQNMPKQEKKGCMGNCHS